MDTQKLLNAPSKKVKVVAKVTKISSIVVASSKIKKSTKNLRKIFERGTYQKKTQLSVLNRYKKRLDSINKESDKKLQKFKKKKGKSFAPKIKPFVGSFFKPSNDPLKTLAQLAAFKAASKLAKGDVLGAVGPGLALASLIFGPKLLKIGGKIALKSLNLGKLEKTTVGLEKGSARASERVAARGAGEGAEGLMKSVKGLRGGVGVLDAVFAAFDYKSRRDEGQTRLQAGAGALAGAAGGIAGWQVGAAIGASLGAGVLGIGAIPGAVIGGIIGSIAGSSLFSGITDMITGANKQSMGGPKTSFNKSLDNYEKVINKFVLFSASSGSYTYTSPSINDNLPLSPTPQGVVNPVPSQNIATNKGGYAADTGLDILTPVGSSVVSPVSGTLEYAEIGHVRQMGQDANPNMPGKQDQHSVRIKLDKPFIYNGKQVRFFYATHMYDLDASIKNKSGIKVTAGQFLGYSGVANDVPHLHVGFVGNREQTEFLTYNEVRSMLSGVPSSSSSLAAAPAAPRAQRPSAIGQYTGYSPSPYSSTTIALPISEQQMQQVPQIGGGGMMILPGPSEQQLLNSFYKRVLLNTV